MNDVDLRRFDLDVAISRLRDAHTNRSFCELSPGHVDALLTALANGGINMQPVGAMTVAQELRLRRLCTSYNVRFDVTHYTRQPDLPSDYVAGWVGGQPGTIYVGVAANGESSS